MSNRKECKQCGAVLERRVSADGKKERLRDYHRRQFCSRRCSGLYYRDHKKQDKPVPVEQPEPSQSIEDYADKKTAKEYLLSVVNDESIDKVTRVTAAKALLPYTEKKAGEKGGKKESQAGRAKQAGAGRFQAAQPPKLVQGGKK